MEGCRGDPDVLEKKIWGFIEEQRAKERAGSDGAPDEADRAERMRRLLAEAQKLREAARELLEKAKELEEAARR